MTKKRSRKKGSVISRSRWLAYATAGLATAAGSHAAEAEIHYSGPVRFRFHGIQSQSMDFHLPHKGALVFDRAINQTGSHSFSFNGANAHFRIEAPRGSVAGFFYSCAYSTNVASVSHLQAGDAVSLRPFVPDGGILFTADGLGCGGGDRGQFFYAGEGYVGFKFDFGQGTQYGWARIKKTAYPASQYQVVDYAYADPGEAITVGQTRSSGTATPTQGSLGWLALGAAGLRAWRGGRSR